MNHTMSHQTLLHRKALATSRVCTTEQLLALMVSHRVVLQVEACGEGSLTTFLDAPEHPSLPRVDKLLVQLQKPGHQKGLIADIAWQPNPVYLSVFLVLSPCLPLERTTSLLTRVTFVHFLMAL